ncbi:MAG: tandem-95 repeat protein [Verrucomicrobia bacterium]|nr:tandem-95 repeat protein [Verrucomicrobiota bacterium]
MKSASIRRFFLAAALCLAAAAPVAAQVLNQASVTRYNNGLVVPTTDIPAKIVVDSSANSYVAGSSGGDIITTKYDASGSGVWTNRYNGPASGNDAATSVAVDASGNAYTAGYSEGTGSASDFVVIKYDSTGTPVWTNRYNGTLNGDDQARALAVDATGNVYVSGGAQSLGSSYDFVTIKYNSSGTPQWTNIYNGPANSSDKAAALVIDATGTNLIVTGESTGSGTGLDYATIKYQPNGTAMWTNRFSGAGNRSDIPVAIAFDNTVNNNVFVTGSSSVSGSGNDYVSVKYNGTTGAPVWTNRYNGTGNSSDQPVAIAVDSARNVYVTGYSYDSASSYDIATVKYDSVGNGVWTNRYNGTQNADDQGKSIFLDGAGNVYVAGTSDNAGSSYDFTVIKVDTAQGTNVWSFNYNGPGNGPDVAASLALDSSGNIYVTGASEGSGTGADFATVKLDSSGAQQWAARYNEFINGADELVALAVDSERNVYLAGRSVGLGSGVDYVVVKQNYSGATVWISRYNGDANGDDALTALTVDASGNVYATGTSDGDYVTVKYSANGAAIWTNRYNGPGNASDIPAAIATDAGGNVVVTGSSAGSAGDRDFATIKYNSSGAGVWTNRYNGPGASDDEAIALGLDTSGNAYVTGSSLGTSSGADYATIRINGTTGAGVWTNRYDGPVNDYDIPSAITLDGSGNVIVTGQSIGDAYYEDYATVKYNGSGVAQWTNRYSYILTNITESPPLSGIFYTNLTEVSDIARAIAVDSSGNVYVTGYSYGSDPFSFGGGGSLKDIATIKYSSAGSQVWVKRFNGPAGTLNDEGTAVDVDAAGNVYVTGSAESAGTGRDFATIKYNSGGAAVSTNYYDGPGSRADVATAVDARGVYNVIVAGTSPGSSGEADFAAILYYHTNAANVAPTADAQSVSTLEDAALPITLTGGDANSDALFYVIITPPANGTLTTIAPNVTYQPNAGYVGADSFTFKTSDGLLESAATTISITVNGVNDAPALSAFTNMVFVGVAGGSTLPFTITQPANENTQTITVTATSSNPSLIPSPLTVNYTSPNSTGNITFTPVANASGSALITVTSSDNGGTANGGVDSTTQTFVVTVYRALVKDPRVNFPVANGPIFTMTETNNTLFIGGGFTEVGTNSGKADAFYATNDAAVGTFPQVDRQVFAVIPDGAGGWYLGGDFTTVGGLPRSRLAHVLAGGTVDPGFTAQVDSTVSALYLNGTNLYVGGLFVRVTNVTGTVITGISNRVRFAVLDKDSGAVRDLGSNPSFDNQVLALLATSNTVYVGGIFTNITNIIAGPTTIVSNRNLLAAIDLSSGQLLSSFAAHCNSNSGNAVRALALSGTNLYFGGDFNTVSNGTTAFTNFRLAAVNYTSGVPKVGFRADLQARARALVVNGNDLFVGGDFTSITNTLGGTQTNRNRLAAVALTNGLVRLWNPNAGNVIRSMVLADTNLYVAGDFTNILGTNALGYFRRRLAAVSTNTANTNQVISAFNPAASDLVNAVAASGGVIAAGGNFSFHHGLMRQRLAAIATDTGEITDWDPTPNNTVLAMTLYGTNLIIGGQFTATRYGTGNRLAVITTNDGSFVAGITNGQFDNTVRALAVSGTRVFAGGDFTIVTNKVGAFERSRVGLMALDMNLNGATATDFIADALLTGGSNVLALAASGSTLYVGGTFTNISGQTRWRLAAVDAANGDIIPGFFVDANNTVQALMLRGNVLYAGGAFTSLTNSPGAAGGTRNRIASLALPNGGITSWNPSAGGTIYALDTIATNVYVGGSLTGTTGGQSRNRMAELSSTLNTATAWNPDSDNTVFALVARNGSLYAGGQFTQLGGLTSGTGVSRQGLVSFDTNSAPVNISPTMNTLANLTLNEDASQTTVNLSGISAGPPSESSQILTLTATSGNTALIPNPLTVTYTDPDTTGSISFTPTANASGSATISVVLTDDGGTANGGLNKTTNTFRVTVFSVNDVPTLNALASVTWNEDPGAKSVTLSGIGSGAANESQVITITATNNNPALFSAMSVTYTSPTSTGTLNYTPAANAFGTATVSVVVTDNGSTTNGGIDSVTNTFSVVVNSVNDTPTLDALGNLTVNENGNLQTINLTGISSGAANESAQVLTVTATSSTPGLIPNPNVSYASPDATGTITFTPVPNASGTATVSVTVNDGGGTANGGVEFLTRSFTVAVTGVNNAPTLNAIASLTLNEDISTNITLTGISAGPGENQTISVAATSSNPGVVPNPVVTYTSALSTGSLAITPAADASGSAVITVVVSDNGGTGNGGVNAVTNAFTVTVNSVNDAPVIDAVANLTLNEDAGGQSLNLTGINAGGGESQTLSLTASSSNTAVIDGVSPTYTSPNSTGTLAFSTVPDAYGTATITIIITDTGGTANGGVSAVTNTFSVVVNSVNDTPAMTPLGTQFLGYNSGANVRSLAGISAGPANESGQTISITATSGNPTLLPDPVVGYTSPNGTGTLTMTVNAAQSGTSLITVVVSDTGGTANGGVDAYTNTFVVNVNAGNTAPVINDQSLTTAEDTALNFILDATDPDPGNTVTVTILTNTLHGTLFIASQTNVTYYPARNYAGLDSFHYQATDGLLTATGTVTITITNVSDLYPFVFSNALTLPAGANPSAIVAAKFYKKIDLAVANYADNTVSIFLGTGGGISTTNPAFQAGGLFTNAIPATVAVGQGPVALAVTDITKDKSNDLVVVNRLGGSVQLLQGNGGGGFTVVSTTSLGAGSAPSGVAVGDFNKDTHLDLAVICESNNTVVILNGNSTGTFTPFRTNAVSGRPMAIVAGDFNKDMKIDLAVANYDSNTVSVLFGGGTGLFSNKNDFAVGQGPTALVAFDFNKDGRVDIAAANYQDDTVSILRSVLVTNAFIAGKPVTSNTFTLTNYPVAVNPSALAAVNVNKDLYTDLVIASHFENTASVMLGKANGQFDDFYFLDPSASQTVGTNPISLASGILNADTDPDVVVANWGSGNVSVLLNNYTPLAYKLKLNVLENTTTLPEGSRSTIIKLQGTYGPLNYVFVTLPTNGTFTSTNGSLTRALTGPELRYETFPNSNGKDLFSYYVQEYNTNGGGKVSAVAKVEIVVLAVNDPPDFDFASNSVTVLEDAPKQAVTNFAVNLDRGASFHPTEAKQTILFVVTNSSSNLFKVQPAITDKGLLTFQSLPNAHGVVDVGVVMKDKGGTLNGGDDTGDLKMFTITIVQSNDKPALKLLSAPKSINEDTTGQAVFTVYDVETPRENLIYRVANVTNTTLFPDVNGNTFTVVGDTSTNFVWGWTNATNRTLTIVPATNQFGTNVVWIQVDDGTNTTTITQTVAIASINDAPSFTVGTNVIVTGTAQITRLLPGWASSMSRGPANENSQTLTFVLKAASTTMFFVSPAVDSANGTLTFTPKTGVTGSTTVSIYLKDNGSSTAPNKAYSTTNTFTIQINP